MDKDSGNKLDPRIKMKCEGNDDAEVKNHISLNEHFHKPCEYRPIDSGCEHIKWEHNEVGEEMSISQRIKVEKDCPNLPDLAKGNFSNNDDYLDNINILKSCPTIPSLDFECDICKTLFETKESLDLHTQDTHSFEDELSGEIDGFEDNEASCSQRYEKDTHSCEDELSDEFDSFEDNEASSLHRHEKESTSPAKKIVRDQKIVCEHPGCGKTFKSKAGLKTHNVSHEMMKDCVHCGQVFNAATILLRHIDRKHNPARLRCPHTNCNQVFVSEPVLKKHLVNHSSKAGSKELTCENCGVKMRSKVSLSNHIAKECSGSTWYPCDEFGCNESFKTKHSLSNHKRMHENANMNKKEPGDWLFCPNKACGQKFTSRKKLRTHLKLTKHNISIAEYPFLCLFRSCDKKYRVKDEVVAHMKAEHWGNRKREAEERKALRGQYKPDQGYSKCPVCYVKVDTDAALRSHILSNHDVSTGEFNESMHDSDPDAAGACEKNDTRPLVFNLKMYKCSLCHISYHTVLRLKLHVESIHANLGSPQLDVLKQLEDDPEFMAEIVKTTLTRDTERARRPRKKLLLHNRKGNKLKVNPERELDQNTRINDSLLGDDISVKRKGANNVVDDKMKHDTSSNIPNEMDVSEDDDTGIVDVAAGNKDDKEGEFICRFPSCRKTFPTRTEMLIHQKIHARNLKCPHSGCTSEFYAMTNLRAHIKYVHMLENFETCKCGRKGKGYKFRKHMETCQETLPFFVCKTCGKVFDKKSSYSNHINHHKEKPLKPCTYEGCTKKFKTKPDLDRHMNTHTGARPFSCPYGGCNKTYKQKPHLLVHLKTHSIIKDERVYPCQYCGYNFKQKSNLMKHLRKTICAKKADKETIPSNPLYTSSIDIKNPRETDLECNTSEKALQDNENDSDKVIHETEVDIYTSDKTLQDYENNSNKVNYETQVAQDPKETDFKDTSYDNAPHKEALKS